MPLSQPAKKVTRLLLVRHGSTNLTEENRFSGSIGVELPKEAREQATRLADRLDQAPACLNVVDFMDPVHARLMLFNDTSHYADAPRRGEAHLSKVWDKVSDSP